MPEIALDDEDGIYKPDNSTNPCRSWGQDLNITAESDSPPGFRRVPAVFVPNLAAVRPHPKVFLVYCGTNGGYYRL